MAEAITAALDKKELPLPEPGAMSYMMSKQGYLSDSGGHWHLTSCSSFHSQTPQLGEQTSRALPS